MTDFQAETMLKEEEEVIEMLKNIDDADQLAIFHYLQGLKAGSKIASQKQTA